MSNEEKDFGNLTRRERKMLQRKMAKQNRANGGTTNQQPRGLSLTNIQPKTNHQRDIFDDYQDGYNILIHGMAGTGKSFLALYLAIKQVMQDENYDKVIIVRSTVPSRQQGFLPGNEKQKAAVYEAPYIGICSELFERGDAYSILKQKNLIEFESTSYLRGTTFRNCIVVFDEVQNANFHEISTVITRIGENCRLMLCGDTSQNDLIHSRVEESGMSKLIRVIDQMDSFTTIEMGLDDIVRSGLVREFLEARYKLNI